MSGAWVPINDRATTILRSVVKETTSIHPSPSIQVPFEGGQFALEENYFLFFPFLFGPSIGVNNFHLVKETRHLPEGVFPFPKAT